MIWIEEYDGIEIDMSPDDSYPEYDMPALDVANDILSRYAELNIKVKDYE